MTLSLDDEGCRATPGIRSIRTVGLLVLCTSDLLSGNPNGSKESARHAIDTNATPRKQSVTSEREGDLDNEDGFQI